MDWKDPPPKPGNGVSIENHPKGAMTTASRLLDRLVVTKFLRPLFNSPFLKPRWAEVDRVLSEVTLPPLEPTKRFKRNKKTGRAAYTVVDKRRQKR